MGLVTTIWSLAAGVSLTLAVVAGSVGMTQRRNPASLSFTAFGIAVAIAAYIELYLMHSATAEEYGEWLRWYHVPFFFAVLAQLLFIRFYLGTSRPWLMWTVVVMRFAVLVGNFAVRPNFNFSNIASLRHPSFLGEQITTIASATTRSDWQWFSVLSLLLMMVYLLDAGVRCWHAGGRESKRKTLAIILGIALPWLCTLIFGQLIVFGAIQGPITNLPWFLGALLVMMFEMSRDYVLSRSALAELAAVRRHQMQLDRISMLGQLSPALAHQLAQPLSATIANAVAGLRHLEREPPDIVELRAILSDINNDGRRGAELIATMRQLIKDHAIEMRPVRVEDIVQEVVHLLQPEADSKGVTLSLIVKPDLPSVIGDRVHLSQVLINLILNAIHAVQSRPPEAKRVVIEARAGDRKDSVELTVRDSGRGIPESLADKVFEPFFTTKPEGMGMGLALSRTIIEAHGGHLWFDRGAAKQDGAVFRFTLQRA
jgi:signal transduction histidine kinase